jgi:hypothetical protein
MESRPPARAPMSVPATCPFCNALVPAGAPVVAGRVTCPRCGEALGPASPAGGVTRSEPAPGTPARGERPHRTRRRAVVGLLAIAAVLGGWAAVANWHRIRSPFGLPTPPAKPVVLKPAELPGLGYLPESTEAVLAVQVPFLLERLGPEAREDPARALAAIGLPQSAAELLDRASGVGLKNVDQLVVGLAFADHALPPEVVIVVHARRPFDLEGIARQAKAHPEKRDGRTVYGTRTGQLPEFFWWKAADRVLVATIQARDFKDVPGQPRTGIDHLRPALAATVRDRIDDTSCAWFAATSDRWDQYLRPYTILPFTPLQGRTDLIKPAERLRTVAVSVPHDADRPVDVQIAVKSADGGAALRASFGERFQGEAVEVSGAEEWARLSLPNDPNRVGPIIERLMSGAK